MENREKLVQTLCELREYSARKQKRGLPFIISSVFLWTAVLCIHISSLEMSDKNLYTFFCTAALIPMAYLISKPLKVQFKDKSDPLSGLGLLFTINQMLYILIVMWIYTTIPDKMLMIYVIIFGAHLLPFGWLYRSKTYYALSVIIPISGLFVGLHFSSAAVAAFMIPTELVFCILLIIENLQNERKA